MGRTQGQPLTIRGLQNMRTSSDAISGVDVPVHKLHMRLCVLEMERYRRDQERRVALERAAKCEERCAAIEQEVKKLLGALARRGAGPLAARLVEAKAKRAGESFVHRY